MRSRGYTSSEADIRCAARDAAPEDQAAADRGFRCAADPCIRFVDADVPSSGDGLSWGTVFATVQEGITAAHLDILAAGGAGTCSVWVIQLEPMSG